MRCGWVTGVGIGSVSGKWEARLSTRDVDAMLSGSYFLWIWIKWLVP